MPSAPSTISLPSHLNSTPSPQASATSPPPTVPFGNVPRQHTLALADALARVAFAYAPREASVLMARARATDDSPLPSPDATASATRVAPPSEDEITSVKLGSAHATPAHCFYCDTRILPGWPCVERIWWHSGGTFSRNNGASTGYCRAGLHPELAHAQCAFRLDTRTNGRVATCQSCKGLAEPGRRIVNYIASPAERCSETSPLYWCFPCTRTFISRHRSLLDGHLGASQQEQGVAWVRHRPLFAPPGLQAGCGLPPLTQSSKAEYLAIFRASSSEFESLAVERHRELQAAILAAMDEDAALAKAARARRGSTSDVDACMPGRRTRPDSSGTPVELKARRMRIDSGGRRTDRDGDDCMAAAGGGERSRSRSPEQHGGR